MKGNDKSRAVLHQRVADKRIAIKQYLICSLMCDNWDNAKFHQETVADESIVEVLTRILKMAEGHVDWPEIQRAQLGQMGLQNNPAIPAQGASS